MRRIIVFVLLLSLLAPQSTGAEADTYHVDETVVVTMSSKPIRARPTSSSFVVTTVQQGELLEIISDTSVRAEGYNWWNVRAVREGVSGWLPETAFARYDKLPGGTRECWVENQITGSYDALSWSTPPAQVIVPEQTYIARIETSAGDIVLKLAPVSAPIATNNFVCLADTGYYDGTTFHRIANDLFIQGGDATGTGTGTPGYTVPSDPTTGNYPEGSIALANSKPDENGAQFFITASDLTGLIPDDYPVFGHVLAGQDVVAAISHGPVEINPRGELSQPIDPVTILSITVSEQDDEVGPPLPDITSTGPPLPSSEAAAAAAPTVVPPPTATVGKVVELDAKDIAFVPTEITIDASDLPVTIRMENTGAAQHNFSIDALKIDINVESQQTVEFEIPAGTEPGTYDFYCNIPGHKEAGMVGKLIVGGDSSTIRPSPTVVATTSAGSCTGFTEYRNAYENAQNSALLANSGVFQIASKYDDSEDALLIMTPSEFEQLTEFTTDLAGELSVIFPPPFASEWHQLQIENVRTFTEVFKLAETSGILLALIAYSDEIDRQSQAIEQALARPGLCPQFVTWASDQ